jgi:hypothetical protein
MLLIAERRELCDTDSWARFREQNADLFHGRELLQRYYSEERLFSSLARRCFVLPDRVPKRPPVETDRGSPCPD